MESGLSRLSEWLAGATGAAKVEILGFHPAARDARDWLLLAQADGSAKRFIVRQDVSDGAGLTLAEEIALLRLACESGVKVPRVMAVCDDANVIGSAFALFDLSERTSLGSAAVRDTYLGGDRSTLAHRLGRELAKIHRIPAATLPAFGAPSASPTLSEIARLRTRLDLLNIRRPALEWGLRWAELNAKAPERVTLVHSDFRTGNYLLDSQGLAAVTGWGFAGWGDPLLDVGTFCAECWRFDRPDLEAGGIGARGDFYAGYEAESGAKIDDLGVRYWEVMAHLRRAIFVQGQQPGTDALSRLAFALDGRAVAELELAVMRATAPATWGRRHGF